MRVIVSACARVPLQSGDTVLLCTDGVWGMLTIPEIGAIMRAQPVTKSLNELLDHAEFRAGAESDNLSAVGMNWGGSNGQVRPGDISTRTLPLDQTTTHMDSFDVNRVSDEKTVTEEDVEKAIAEIQAAIKKYSN